MRTPGVQELGDPGVAGAAAGPKPGRPLRAVKAGLSVFLLFHLFCVGLFPLSDTPTGMKLTEFVQPYVFTLELTNNWNFFSPNPSPPIYIEYELVGENGEAFRSGRWPEPKNPFFWRDRQVRRITATDFMMSGEMRAEKMMVSYFCGSTSPRPRALRLWRVAEPFPTTAEVVAGTRKLGDGVGAERKFVSHTFCSSAEGA
jgi:hypothetical protein